MGDEVAKCSVFKLLERDEGKHEFIQYGFDRLSCYKLEFEVSQKIGKTICETNISMPLLKINDSFYIDEIDETVVVKNVIRTSSDKVLYLVTTDTSPSREELSKYIQELYVSKDKYDELAEKYNRLESQNCDLMKVYNKIPKFIINMFNK